MKILALETATLAGSVAVTDSEAGLSGEVRINIRVAHAERLMPSIQWLLDASRLSISDIDVFAISIGPGSFTGLRIGLSTVKGFAYATKKPVVSVPTLDAFARTLPYCSHFICPILDARKNEVYAGLYKWEDGECRKVMKEVAIGPSDLLRGINSISGDEKVVFMGEGINVYREVITDALQSRAVIAPQSKMTPSASSVAEIAIEQINQGVAADPVTLTPLYIRKSEAEILWKG